MDDTKSRMDAIRASEFPYLDESGQAYLDYTGAALPPLSLTRAHCDRLSHRVWGNPHSRSPASQASTERIEQARTEVLQFCGADPATYEVIFTPNTTGAIRLVAEAYPFGADTPLAMLADNHNSVLGLRHYATRAGSITRMVPLGADLRADEPRLEQELETLSEQGRPGLLAYPAESNATGVQHPLSWVSTAHSHGWRVLLDAAAFAPTSGLDLQAVPADFVTLSWYKITGFPAGAGCLIARRDALEALQRPWFTGGTVYASSAQVDWHLPLPAPDSFEDGTLPFLILPDITEAVRWHTAIGYPAIQQHTGRLTRRLLTGLRELAHPGGRPAAQIVGPADDEQRGPTVAFNLIDEDGALIDERACEEAAAAAGINLRTGCFCNPGVFEHRHQLTQERLRSSLARGNPCDMGTYQRLLPVRTQGVVRVSVGVANNDADIDRVLEVCADVARNPTDIREPRIVC
ncbi:selenocysteine lyase/cysteine desulfurase [Actinopolyspora biskrensis]|uniref:Selenocysteine lyase/cysteine desulfurase n=1 Tax=Actinopolyspora biskrensis TaxID=1470178 RepID=A0A852ZF95_9ACTN|nr:aminotransferase class V-fold PLP-dependent enzyme [Actinopolyspora biskrensis]NYH80643.1 selenocysteine lyase/cysteine desulfurase [Actinopolyspora biskrensis]